MYLQVRLSLSQTVPLLMTFLKSCYYVIYYRNNDGKNGTTRIGIRERMIIILIMLFSGYLVDLYNLVKEKYSI